MAKEAKETTDVAEVTPITVEQMKQQQELEAQIPALQSSLDIVERIQAAILAGQSDEDVFEAAAAGLASGENLVDVPLNLLNYTYNKSGFEAGLPVYAVVSAVNLETGEKIDFSFGASSAIAQLHRFEALKPFKERDGLNLAIRSKRTASGYDALYFGPLTPGEKKRVGLAETE